MRFRSIGFVFICLFMFGITFFSPSYVLAVYECGGYTDNCPCEASNPFGCQLGNCTWWAWHRICCIWGAEPAWEIVSNWGLPIKTCDWDDKARNRTFFKVNHTPAIQTVAVREAHADNYDYGHVAWVEAVNGNQVTVTEMAWGVSYPGGYRTRTYDAGYFDGGYIHYYHDPPLTTADGLEHDDAAPLNNGAIPVYHFYSTMLEKQLLSIDSNEKDTIIANFPEHAWKYRGIVWYVYPVQQEDTIPVYRFYSPVLQSHLFTTDANEKNTITATFPETVWRYEGVSFFVYLNYVNGTAPVFRLYSETLRTHFFTMNSGARDSMLASGRWRDEGIAYYAFANG